MLPPLAERNLLTVLRRNLLERPDRPALRDKNSALTHSQLWYAALKCAGGMASAGVKQGDLVIVMLDNCVEFFVVVAALDLLGAIPVPTNTASKGAGLQHVLRDSGASIAIAESHYIDALVQEKAGLTTLIMRGHGQESVMGGSSYTLIDLVEVLDGEMVEPVTAEPWDAMAVMYTSGTTGAAKGVVLTHAAAYGNAYAPDIQGSRSEEDVYLIVCPMFHNLALLAGVYCALITGCSAVIADNFSASQFWNDVDAAGATCAPLVSTICDILMSQPPSADDRRHTLRNIHVVPMPSYAEQMKSRFGINQMSTGYGSTESGAVITNVPPRLAPSQSIGRVRPGWEVRLVDEHDVQVADGRPGEAIARADEPWMMATGYLNQVGASVELWRNGWFHTGDLLRRDAAGWYYFVGRVKDAVRRQGENISLAEVERDILAHLEVIECAAVGIGDPGSDQEIKILVRIEQSSTLDASALIRFAIDRMPYYAVPRYVVFVGEFPRTATGKIRKVDLASIDPGTWDRIEHGIAVRRRR